MEAVPAATQERSRYSEYKVKYSYMDARRWANMRGGLMIRGPLKIFDTTPALIGGLYADKNGRLREYGNRVFDFFSTTTRRNPLPSTSSRSAGARSSTRSSPSPMSWSRTSLRA